MLFLLGLVVVDGAQDGGASQIGRSEAACGGSCGTAYVFLVKIN